MIASIALWARRAKLTVLSIYSIKTWRANESLIALVALIAFKTLWSRRTILPIRSV